MKAKRTRMRLRRGRNGNRSSSVTSPEISTPTRAALANSALCPFLRRARLTTTDAPSGAAASSSSFAQLSATGPLRSTTAIEAFLEWCGAQAAVGGDELLTGAAQLEIGSNNRLDRIDRFVGGETGADQVTDRGPLVAGTAEC